VQELQSFVIDTAEAGASLIAKRLKQAEQALEEGERALDKP